MFTNKRIAMLDGLLVFSFRIRDSNITNNSQTRAHHAPLPQVALWLVPSAEEAKNITKQDIWTFFETFLPAAPECTKLVPVQPVPIPPPVGTEDKARNVLAACLQESLRLKKRIAYAVDPDGRGVRVSFKALQKVC